MFSKLKPYLQPWFYILDAQKSRLIKTTLLSAISLRFKVISLTMVLCITMEEVCYTEFVFAFQI